MNLTTEQKDYLILLGKPDDGSKTHVVQDGERLTQELCNLGLVYRTTALGGEDTYDLTDEGERLYGRLTGEAID